MKRLVLLMLLLVMAFEGFSQTKGISYQAVILSPNAQEIPDTNAQGNILANSAVSIQFIIVNASGTEEYKENQTTRTDRYGMINLLIGTGTQISSTDFAVIVWNGTTKKLKVGIDFSGGSNFSPLSEQNLTYMPQPINERTAQVISGIIVDQAILKKEISKIELVRRKQGVAGPQGIQGEAGVQGPVGQTGATGPIGPNGDTGAAGTNGINGQDGLSAYEVYAASNVDPDLREADWLVSLTGDQGIQGSAGAKGDIGAAGIDGTNGAVGAKGDQGVQGVIGDVGPNGDTGAAGTNGINGQDGLSAYEVYAASNVDPDLSEADWLVSLTGDQGIQGSAGAKGDIGAAGIDGTNGAVGAKGDQGVQGVIGDVGPNGDTGAAGTNGINGQDGLSAYEVYAASNVDPDLSEADWFVSLTGDQGIQGSAGAKGDIGAAGIDGTNGAVGAKGDQGVQGVIGDVGPNGDTGSAGTNGINGQDGLSAYEVYAASNVDPDLSEADWLVSLTGDQGIQGSAGAKGDIGAAGIDGTNGAVGAKGDQGVQGVIGDVGPNGDTGAAGTNGINGQDGLSAYEVYAASNVDPDLSEADWLVSLTGDQGIQGSAGAKGDIGAAGIDGTNGAVGAKGDQGVQGVIGDVGPNGDTGAAGTNGINGQDGLSAYEVYAASNVDPDLSESDWFVSLKGDQGIQGETGDVGPKGDTFPAGTTAGDMQYWNGSAWVIVPTTDKQGVSLQLIDGIPTWVSGPLISTPGAVIIGIATGGSAQAIVTFTAPASNGGAEIIVYTVTSSPDVITATGTNSPLTITGLKNGKAYTFTVTATNAVGTGTASAASNSVTPATVIPKAVVSPTGRTWLDRNLGATQVATSFDDEAAYGDLYQWGRGTDGHQLRSSATTPILSSIDNPKHGDFILVPSAPNDWLSLQNDKLWQDVNGVNNPCPIGYRIPTQTELEAELQRWTEETLMGAFNSILSLPVARYREAIDGSVSNAGNGYYWSSTVNAASARGLYFNGSFAFMESFPRGNGCAVRCIKN